MHAQVINNHTPNAKWEARDEQSQRKHPSSISRMMAMGKNRNFPNYSNRYVRNKLPNRDSLKKHRTKVIFTWNGWTANSWTLNRHQPKPKTISSKTHPSDAERNPTKTQAMKRNAKASKEKHLIAELAPFNNHLNLNMSYVVLCY